MGAAPQISPARGSGGKKLARMSVTGVRAFFVNNTLLFLLLMAYH